MKLKTSLCSNCIHVSSCALRNGSVVQDCEQHEVQMAVVPDTVISDINRPEPSNNNRLEHFKGLCNSCTHANNCIWNRKDNVVFRCEHYD